PSSITLVHTNDIHAHMDQFNKFGNDCTEKDIAANTCYGGAARQRTVIDMLRKRNPGNTLLFDAGDQFQGTAFYSYYKGNVTAEVMNDFKYDLMTIGNHEFDDGPEHLAKFFRKLQFPVVCANADFSREESLRPIVKPYHYFPKHDLAVIGYITNTTKFISSPGPNIEFYDPAPPVQKVIDEIKAKGIKRIFAVSHNGYREDMDLAARTRGLDLIVGGHSHTYLSMDPNEPGSGGLYPTKVTNLDGRTTYVVQAKAWGEYVGHLDINFGSDGHISSLNGAPIHLDQSVPEEPNTKAKVLKWREVLDAFGKVVLGEATASFDQASCQHKECDMGNLVADAMLYARRSRPEVRAVILNAGGARAGIDAGPVRVENVNTILPFLNTLVDFDYSGKQLRQLFEDILAKKNRESGKPITSFVQVSGIKAKFDLSRPAYDRVTELLIRKAGPITTKSPSADAFEPVQPDTVYALSSVEYLLRGGDGFFATPPKETPLGTLAEALSDYIRAASPISPRNEGRL
ncbi:Metallo-dependent phosphatase-like protein, partial [Thamnocephalis sphaerospora]